MLFSFFITFIYTGGALVHSSSHGLSSAARYGFTINTGLHAILGADHAERQKGRNADQTFSGHNQRARVLSGLLHIWSTGVHVGSVRVFGYQHVGTGNAKVSLWGYFPTRTPNTKVLCCIGI